MKHGDHDEASSRRSFYRSSCQRRQLTGHNQACLDISFDSSQTDWKGEWPLAWHVKFLVLYSPHTTRQHGHPHRPESKPDLESQDLSSGRFPVPHFPDPLVHPRPPPLYLVCTETIHHKPSLLLSSDHPRTLVPRLAPVASFLQS